MGNTGIKNIKNSINTPTQRVKTYATTKMFINIVFIILYFKK